MTLERLQVIIEAQTKAYYDELRKVQQQTKSTTSTVEKQTEKIKGAFSKIGKTIGAALSVAALVSFGKGCIELGSNLAEVQNVVDVTFGSMSDTINQFARNAVEQFGLSETSAKKYSSTMGAMLKSMGFTTNEAASMSMTITGLSADMASFYNLDSETAFEKIRSGISGETEPLKQLGINMSVANLEAYALSQGITKAYNAMTQQEQAMLRYNYLMKATADAQGDFARTSDGWANQVRVLEERFNSLKASIGQGLIAAFTPVIKVVNDLLSRVLTLTDAFSNMIAKVTGKSTKTTTSVSNIGGAVDVATDSMGSLGAATDEAGNSASSAAKKYAGLASFDELNTLSSNKDSGSSDTAGSGASSGNIAESIVEAATESESLNPVLDKVLNKLKEIQNLFKNGFKSGIGKVNLSGIKNAVNGIKSNLKGIFTDSEVLGAANGFIDSLAYSMGQRAGAIVSVGETIASNVLGGINTYLADNKGRIKQFLTGIFDIGSEMSKIQGDFSQAVANIFSVFGGKNGQKATANFIGIFSNAFMGVTQLVGNFGKDILNLITKPFIDNQEALKEALDGTLGVVSEQLETIKSIVDGALGSISALYDEHIKPLLDSFTSGLSKIVGTATEAYNTHILPVLQGIQEKFEQVVNEHLQPAIDKVTSFIGKVVDAIKELWENVLQPFVQWFVENIAPVIGGALETVGGVFSTLFGTISDVVGNIFDALSGLIDFITGVFTGDWNKAWEGIKSFFGGIWDAIKNLLSGAWEAIKQIVSAGINAISSVISPILNGIKDAFTNIWNGIKNTTSTVWNGIKSAVTTPINAVKDGISNVLGSIKKVWNDAWNTMKNTVSNIFNGIWNTIKGVINGILGGIEGMANGIIKGINTMINAMNKLSFDIPDWVPGLGGNKFGFDLKTISEVHIPRLKDGGLPAVGQLFVAREAGPELVGNVGNQTTVMNNDQIVESVANGVYRAVVAAMGENKGGNQSIYIDGRKIFEVVKQYNNRERIRTGTSPLLV